jgi:hypothetical protein
VNNQAMAEQNYNRMKELASSISKQQRRQNLMKTVLGLGTTAIGVLNPFKLTDRMSEILASGGLNSLA